VDELVKCAGGGARTLKSFRRLIERMSDSVIAAHRGKRDEVLRTLLSEPLFHSTRGKALVEGGQKRPVFFFTQGGTLNEGTPTYKLSVPQIRKMRGKFAADPAEMSSRSYMYPGNALQFKGKVPVRLLEGTAESRRLPGNLQVMQEHFSPTQHDANVMATHLNAANSVSTPRTIAATKRYTDSLVGRPLSS
jgi:hypothetical protein